MDSSRYLQNLPKQSYCGLSASQKSKSNCPLFNPSSIWLQRLAGRRTVRRSTFRRNQNQHWFWLKFLLTSGPSVHQRWTIRRSLFSALKTSSFCPRNLKDRGPSASMNRTVRLIVSAHTFELRNNICRMKLALTYAMQLFKQNDAIEPSSKFTLTYAYRKPVVGQETGKNGDRRDFYCDNSFDVWKEPIFF